jgi:hypothetical protein
MQPAAKPIAVAVPTARTTPVVVSRELTVRVLAALALGLTAGVLVLLYLRREAYLGGGDFAFVWRGARALAQGLDPYRALQPDAEYGAGGPLVYPAVTVLATLPLVRLDPFTASAVFFGLSVAVFAFALSASGYWRLFTLASPPMVCALLAVNFPPLLAAAALLAPIGWLAVLKPNLGVIAFAYRPQWRTVWLGGALLLSSFLWIPDWPRGWLYQMQAQHVSVHRPALFYAPGAVALLGLLRWRTPEGRALAAYAVVPTGLFPYDALMLWLCVRTRRELAVLTLCAWLVAPAALGASTVATPTELAICEGLLHLGMTVPATIMVLSRPNVSR